jgi:hypothetical protein
MKKGILMILLAAVVAIPLVMYGTIVVAGGPAEDISIDKAAEFFKGGKKRMTAVPFSHSKHAELVPDCLDCHHKADKAKLDAGEAPLSCVADGCHGPDQGEVDGKERPDTKGAFHAQCKDCHKTNKDKGASTKCSACHPK